MEAYIRENYTKCSQNFTFFDSFQFVAISSHSVLFLTIPINFFGFYCILYRTPRKMMAVRTYLLHLQFWTFTLDFFYTSLLTPVFFFPALATCSIGVLAWFNVPPVFIYSLGMVGYGGLATATIMILDYRNHSLMRVKTSVPKLNNKFVRVIWHCSNFAICFIVCICMKLNIDEREVAKYEYLEILPCPIYEYFTECNFIIDSRKNYFILGIALYMLHISNQVILLASLSFYNIYMLKTNFVSKATRRFQRSLFVGTCIQVTVPLCALMFPIGYCFYAIFHQYYNQAFLNMTSFCISLHGIVATLMLIRMNSPYLEFAKNLIFHGGDNKKNGSIIQVISIRSGFM